MRRKSERIGKLSSKYFSAAFRVSETTQEWRKRGHAWFHVEHFSEPKRQFSGYKFRVAGQPIQPRPQLFHVEQLGPNGKPLEKFVATSFVLCNLQLPKIMPTCALVQRMGISEQRMEKAARKPKLHRFQVVPVWETVIGAVYLVEFVVGVEPSVE